MHVPICAGIGVACGSGHALVGAVATLLAVGILGSYRVAYGSKTAESDMWGPLDPAAKNVTVA